VRHDLARLWQVIAELDEQRVVASRREDDDGFVSCQPVRQPVDRATAEESCMDDEMVDTRFRHGVRHEAAAAFQFRRAEARIVSFHDSAQVIGKAQIRLRDHHVHQ